jgi:hypothetical protein
MAKKVNNDVQQLALLSTEGYPRPRDLHLPLHPIQQFPGKLSKQLSRKGCFDRVWRILQLVLRSNCSLKKIRDDFARTAALQTFCLLFADLQVPDWPVRWKRLLHGWDIVGYVKGENGTGQGISRELGGRRRHDGIDILLGVRYHRGITISQRPKRGGW